MRHRQAIRRRVALTTLLALLASLPATRASAQVGEEIPRADYYIAVQAFYLGEYRDAERELRREVQRGFRTALAKWVDSVCYHAMLGEVFYHQGRNAEALAQFDQACQYIIAYSDWLRRVNFRQGPQPDPNPARRIAPWGPSTRQAVQAKFPRTEQVAFGQLDPTQVLQRGGVFAAPEYRRVNVVEIVRTSALAIRRRGELLGPLAPHDPLFKELLDKLSRGNLTPPNHWSSMWIDLERGLVLAALGRTGEASMALNRATMAAGQLDHPLTCIALLEQGRLAMQDGNGAAAAQMFYEASLSAFAYENLDALTESLWLGWLNHQALGGAGVYRPLEPAATWAQTERFYHVVAKLRLAQAESLLWLGQVPQATTLLASVERPLARMGNSLARIHHLYLESAAYYLQGRPEPGGDALARALAAQSAASLRNFQIGLTGTLYDAGTFSPRVAVELYQELLADPEPVEWALRPLDVLAVLKTSHDAAFDRWFLAAAQRKEVATAIEVAERAKRRRFLASLPLGGRLLALRTILEAPDRELSQEALLQRQQILSNSPDYRNLSSQASQLFDELRAGSPLARPGDDAQKLASRFDDWADNATEREQLIMQWALRPLPSSLEFPPWRTTEELQKSLADGQAILLFHAAGDELYGFLITADGADAWKLSNPRHLRAALTDFLQDMGNHSAGSTLSIQELRRDAWQKSSAELYQAVFLEALLDLDKISELVIVPDDILWYLPFEALVYTPENERPQLLADRVSIRYGPTAALVVGDDRPLRRPLHTGIVGNELNDDEAITAGQDLLAELEKLTSGPLRLSAPLPEPGYLLAPLLDGLIVFDELSTTRAASRRGQPLADWSPLPRPQRKTPDSLDAWLPFPQGGPQHVILTSFSTAAEQGLRGATRRNGPPPGSELFQLACRLMASDARTLLLSRWRTSGRTNFDLVREFVQELPHGSASDAWRRAVILARESPLDASREPRMKRSDTEADPLTADHPFFWAGYLLIDTGPAAEEEQAAAPEAGEMGGATGANAAEAGPPGGKSIPR